MSDTRDRFERARRPGEKAVRREAILAAAADLLDRHQLQDVSLNAIAHEAGLSKPNLYRYFESREEILLALFLEDLRSFTDDVVSGLSGLTPGQAEDDVASVLVEAYAKRPRLCRFLGVIASVFEHNVSTRVIEEIKTVSLDLASEVATALYRVRPQLTFERCLWLNNVTALLVGGLWPPAHPAEAVSEVLAKPELAVLRPDFRRDLHEAIVTLIRGS
jgi:AcrR family transcriptional regulator